ncbi:MAG: hypothetical protein ACM3X0_00140 [Bacteroidota bacterium]
MQGPARRLGFGAYLLLAVLLAAAAASLYVGFKAASADAISLQARWQISQWQAAGAQARPGPAELGAVRNDLMAALDWTPGDPQLYENLGYVYGVRAARAEAIPELNQAFLADSIGYYRQATTLRPMSTYAWANLALGLHLQGDPPESIWPAYDRAYRYGNREAGVQRILAEIGFAHWAQAGAERQGQLIRMIDIAYPHAKGDLVRIAEHHGKAGLLDQ